MQDGCWVNTHRQHLPCLLAHGGQGELCLEAGALHELVELVGDDRDEQVEQHNVACSAT